MENREDHVRAEQARARLQGHRTAAVRPAPLSRDQDLERLVTCAPEPLPDGRGRRQRDVVLARAAAPKDGDPHPGLQDGGALPPPPVPPPPPLGVQVWPP